MTDGGGLERWKNSKLWILINILLIVAIIIGIGILCEREDPYADMMVVECSQDTDCIKARFLYRAERICARAVEDAAPWGYEWFDSFTQPKFHTIYPGAPSFRLAGDRVRFQNQYGAWRRMNYICWYNPLVEYAEVTVQ